MAFTRVAHQPLTVAMLGTIVGIASAYVVISTGTRATFVEKVGDYLDRMDELVDAAIAR